MIQRNLSRFPLVVERFSRTFTNEDLERFVDESLANPLLRSRTWASVAIVDNALKMIDPAQTRIWARFVDESMDYMEKYCVGTAVVANTPLIRGMTNYMMSKQSTPMPVKLFASEESAYVWAIDQIESHVGLQYRSKYEDLLPRNAQLA